MHLTAGDPQSYLGADPVIDFSHPDVRDLVDALSARSSDDVDFARRAYLYARDEVRHSFDVADSRVVVTASDTVRAGVGLCHAKSHLLVALLRSRGVPAGLCYQRLGRPSDGFALHGLVAFWVDGAWHRVDPRGNKPGVDAQFSLTEERLAWPVDPAVGEIDYGQVHVHPHSAVVSSMRATDDILTVALPTKIIDGSLRPEKGMS